MGTPLSQECHLFLLSFSAYDLVVTTEETARKLAGFHKPKKTDFRARLGLSKAR
jgi:hypothetical protein